MELWGLASSYGGVRDGDDVPPVFEICFTNLPPPPLRWGLWLWVMRGLLMRCVGLALGPGYHASRSGPSLPPFFQRGGRASSCRNPRNYLGCSGYLQIALG